MSRFFFESLIELDGLISAMRWCFTDDDDKDQVHVPVPVLDNVNVTIMSLDPVQARPRNCFERASHLNFKRNGKSSKSGWRNPPTPNVSSTAAAL
jgi:hypothetical protein